MTDSQTPARSEIALPAAPQKLIASTDQLAEVCAHLREAGIFAFDTEFIGENTYQPILCLIQVATAERVELIDPMKLDQAQMRLFWELLADPSIEKICHAGDQDVEIMWQHSGLATRNMFDTQIGAGMLGISYPTALWRAVEYFTGVTLEKAHTFSAWDRRPLSSSQFSYAVDDVRYLPAIHAAMKQRLEERGHMGWMRGACDDMCAEAARPSDARKLYARIRGAAGLDSEQLSVLREVTALREQIAYEHDTPARAFMKDEVLLEIATKMPETAADLGHIRDLPREELESYGEALLQAVATGAGIEESQRPSLYMPGEDSAEVKRLAETLWVATQVICLGQSVTPALVTSQNEILGVARLVHKRKPFDKHPLMSGWHRECLGEKLAALIKGEMRVGLTMNALALEATFAARQRTINHRGTKTQRTHRVEGDMCGIAGVVKFGDGQEGGRAQWHRENDERKDLSALENMSAAIAHRGPDGEGMWVDPRPGKRVGLVHRRLAIIDRAGGVQPMGNEDGTVQVVFNGEIYNHMELRRELVKAGHRFASDHSDTEVLVHGWEQWGTELPKRLLGMFAFAIWDRRENADTLFLWRDRMGQKPLFYAMLEDGLVFGSTIGSVLAWPEVPRRVPREQIGLYLMLGYIPPPQTIWRDINQVVPGGWVRVRRDVVDGGIYWAAAPSRITRDEPRPTQQVLRDGISRAVESQLIADVPIACFLSGGIDSSIIAAVMQQAVRRLGGDPIRTVSVGFAESGFDETAYAVAVAERIGSVHTRLEVHARQGVMETLQQLMDKSLGQPFADSSILPTYQLSKAVREIAPVALSGDGADELFGGYDRYRAMMLLDRWGGVARLLPRSMALGSLGKKERYRRLAAAARTGDVAGRYTRLSEIFSRESAEELLGGGGGVDEPLYEEAAAVGGSSGRYAMLRDQRTYLPGDVLWKVDSASMLEALEVRSPFLDHRVVEQANGLDDADLFHGGVGKWILREAFASELPPQIRARGKKGFGVPIGEWFKEAGGKDGARLRETLHDLIGSSSSFTRNHLQITVAERLLREHESGRRDHTHRLFALLMLELWWHKAGATIE